MGEYGEQLRAPLAKVINFIKTMTIQLFMYKGRRFDDTVDTYIYYGGREPANPLQLGIA